MTRTDAPDDRWSGRKICVAGAGVSGAAAARVLAGLGARVVAVDGRETPAAAELSAAGVQLSGDVTALPAGTELVVTSPGWRPDQPLLVAAAAAGVPVWGEVELAWQLRGAGAAPWLAVTGTNGKTTTVRMLAAMLTAAGLRTVAAGNVGTPLLEVVTGPARYDVIAVELSSFQLHWSHSVAPEAAAVLNIAPDHLDWHGSFEAYAAAKARIWAGAVAIGNADDPATALLLAAADAPRRVPFTLREPAPGELGVVGGELVDAAFSDLGAETLADVDSVRPPGPHNVANALAAAALARAHGVPAGAVAAGLRAYHPDPHRNQTVGEHAGVVYVDDSKATNPHAAAASLAAYPHVVWIAGGLLKGADVDALVAEHRHRLRAAVLIGRDRGEIAAALRRHAPDVPVVDLAATDTGAMTAAVREAARLAVPGDAVLLAPAAASMDMFRDYAERGDRFAAAARALATA